MPKPYAFVNDEMLNYVYLRDHLPGLPIGGRAKFDQLNAHILNEVVLPGQIVIVGDDATQMCTPEETELMRLAQDVRLSMIGTGYASSNVMTQNFDLLQSIMAYGSIGVGSSTAAWARHLRELETLLKDTEALHQRWKSAAITNDQFFAQRKALFSKIEKALAGIGRFGSGLRNTGKMKKMLGISSKSYLHTGEIAGYARTVKHVAKTANALSKGTYVGIALDVGVGALEIQEACSVGREEECRRAKYVETAKTAGGIGLAWIGGSMGGAAGPAICLGLGVPSGGGVTLACAIIGGALAAWGFGTAGSIAGDKSATYLYEAVYGK
jgi:hypothetical protein